jgi:6-phosphogluconolactonase
VTEPEIVVVADADAAAEIGAVRTAEALSDAAEERGRADWAAAGGTSPIGLYRRLADPPLRGAVPWSRIHVWWGDDRFVPRDHPLSNVKPFDDILLRVREREEGTAGGPAGVPIPIEQVHPWPTGESIAMSRSAAWCADLFADQLLAHGPPLEDGWPSFDLLMLGVGADGHILSVFPGSPAIGVSTLAMAIPAPTHIEPHVVRVTLNPAVAGAARRVLVVATGAGKAEVLGEIFGETWDPVRWPAQLARRKGATWIVDEPAAARIPR